MHRMISKSRYLAVVGYKAAQPRNQASGNSTSMKLLTPLFTLDLISTELLMLMSLQAQVAARKRFLHIAESTDHGLELLKLLLALESPVLLGNKAFVHLKSGFCDTVPPANRECKCFQSA